MGNGELKDRSRNPVFSKNRVSEISKNRVSEILVPTFNYEINNC